MGQRVGVMIMPRIVTNLLVYMDQKTRKGKERKKVKAVSHGSRRYE